MTLVINSPSPGYTRSSYADWLELQALTHPTGQATSATLSNVLDIVPDDADELNEGFDPETRESLDNSIAEEGRADTMLACFDELEYRQNLLGNSYPFHLEDRGQILRAAADPIGNAGSAVYIFCLLVSAIRDNWMHPPKEVIREIPSLFQVCSCLAAGGYIGGEVSSFGFPREDSTSFLDDLRNTYKRFGAGVVHEVFLSGVPANPKDEGIDVIAWRNHPDHMPGKIYLLGQCASGSDWKDKTIRAYIQPFHGSWFSRLPATDVLSAMFIPFTVHREQHEKPGEPFLDTIKGLFYRRETQFGIVFDRLRMAYHANALAESNNGMKNGVDGHDQVDRIEAWLRQMFGLVGIETVR